MKKILVTVSLIFIVVQLYAQFPEIGKPETFDPTFEVFKLPEGILGNSVQGIVQDSAGYMWFASQGGLHRYDGQNFVTFHADPNNPNSINSDYVEYIFLDSKGLIWVAHWTGGGITSYDPDLGIFTRYVHDPDDPESIISGEMGVITEDNEGYIWVGGIQGLSRLDTETGKFKRFLHNSEDPSSLSHNYIRGLYVDKLGALWVATGLPWFPDEDGGLNRYDPESETFTRFLHDPDDPLSLADNKVRAMFEDSKGNFWIGTRGDGLHQFDRNSETFVRFSYDPDNPDKLTKPYLTGENPERAAPFSHISSIYEDRQERIWITAVAGGINVYDPRTDKVSHFEMGDDENGLTTNFIWQTYQSEDGTMWIITGQEGGTVYKVKEQELIFPFFDTKSLNGDSLSFSHGILKDENGKIWIGQVTNGADNSEYSSMWRVDRDEMEMKQIPLVNDSLSINGWLGPLTFDQSGNIWAPTSKGYFVGNPDESAFKLFEPPGVPQDYLTVAGPIVQTSTGNIWIPGWQSGIIRYSPETGDYEVFRRNPDNPKFPQTVNPVWNVYEDRNGDILIGGGTPWPDAYQPLFLDKFNPTTNSFEPLIKESISQGVAISITEDLEGNLWFINFFEGLYKLNPSTYELKKFTPYNSLLPPGRLLSMKPHPDGNIWISAVKAIIELDPLSETMTIYDESHGIRPAERSFFSAEHVAKDGELVFARDGGFHAFYPDQFFGGMESKLPDLRITGFRLLDEHITSGISQNQEGILNKPIWKTSEIELSYDENIFSFSVACFDFYDPEANHIQFMLEGYDRGWRKDIQDGETPSYINVSPGEYTFRLRGSNSLGVWNKEGISLKVIINPPWWTTWWAYFIYGFVFIISIYLVDRVQRRRLLQKANTEAREKELEQAREIEKAYNELKTTQSQLIQSEKMASLGELTAGIAHEIQNPLNFVNNFSDVNSELVEELKEEIDKGNTDEAKAIADDIGENEKKIVHHGKRAEEIVRSMLQHSRGSEGKKEPTDINTLADEYLRLAYHGMRAKDKSFNVTMDTELDPKVGEIEVVPQDIGRVILNLITNAFFAVNERKASVLREPQESEAGENGYQPVVSVTTKKTNGRVEIDVKDNGSGIPEDVKKKIFQPFFSTKGTGKGTGLGLSLSYDIITKGHGGSIEVKSKEGEGTEFKIFLPEK